MSMENKMKVLFVLVGIVFVLAQQARAGFLSKLLTSSSYVDFDAFDKWLVKGLPKDEDPQRNLEHVKKNLYNLSNEKAKRAANIFLEFVAAKECNEDMLMYARDMRRNSFALEGPKRSQRLIKSRLGQVFEVCSNYIGQRVHEIYRTNLDGNLGQFLEVVVLEPNKWKAPVGSHLETEPSQEVLSYILNPRDFNLGPEPLKWRDYLTELAQDDPRSTIHQIKWNNEIQDYKMTFYPENFKYIYDKYLGEPCQTLIDALGDTFKGLFAMAELEPSDDLASSRKLTSSHRRPLVLQLLYSHKTCRRLQSLTPREIDVISEAIDLGLYGKSRKQKS